MRTIAITRGVSPAIERCELTHLERAPISLARAAAQHRAYEAALRGLGVDVLALPAEPDLPDAVFVEDAAIVLPGLAILTRPGAASRRAECESVGRALARFRGIRRIEPPATLDGGDVLAIGKRVFVGATGRTNSAAADQLAAHLEPFGYQVVSVTVTGCLHLKSAATQAGADTVLLNPRWIDARQFSGTRIIEIDASEPYAANVLNVGDVVFAQPAYPRTRERLAEAGIETRPLDQSELLKAEGALTCCSILFEG